MFLATLQGTGRIWLQSLPFSRLAGRILALAPSSGGQDMGEGSVIDGRLDYRSIQGRQRGLARVLHSSL